MVVSVRVRGMVADGTGLEFTAHIRDRGNTTKKEMSY